MRKISLSLFMTLAVAFGAGVFPAMAQTSSGSSSVLSGFLNKQKPAPLQTQTVTAPRSAYEDAMKTASRRNKQAVVSMAAAHNAESTMRMKQVEAMFAAEKNKALAAAAPRPEGSPDSLAGAAAQAKAPYAPPSNAIRVYTPKKDSSGDKPRRLFNVREE